MENNHIALGIFEFIHSEDITVLEAFILRLILESLALNTGHIEDIKPGHRLIQR